MLFIVFLWWTAPRINQAAFDEIEVGMSRQEVETILNCQGRKWRSLTLVQTNHGPTVAVEWLDFSRLPNHQDFRSYAWSTDEMLISIGFDADDRVREKSALPGRFDAGWFAKVRRVIVSRF